VSADRDTYHTVGSPFCRRNTAVHSNRHASVDYTSLTTFDLPDGVWALQAGETNSVNDKTGDDAETEGQVLERTNPSTFPTPFTTFVVYKEMTLQKITELYTAFVPT
jgi:hypothetical protein